MQYYDTPEEKLCFGEQFLDQQTIELLSCINITRAKAGNSCNVRPVEISWELCKKAKKVAKEYDERMEDSVKYGGQYDKLLQCSLVWFDEDASTTELVGPPDVGDLATGELWASGENKRHGRSNHSKSSGGIMEMHCPCYNYQMYSAIVNETWRYIGISKSPRDQRWVVILSDMDTIVRRQNIFRKPGASAADYASTYKYSLQTVWDVEEDREEELHVPGTYSDFW